MTASATPATGGAGAACRVNWDVLERRCHELGAETDIARGRLLGVDRGTVRRWRRGDTGVALATAVRISEIVGVRLEQLITVDVDGASHG